VSFHHLIEDKSASNILHVYSQLIKCVSGSIASEQAMGGSDSFQANFAKDEFFDLILVWLPADHICLSVPLYLRLPVRHVVSFRLLQVGTS
jgi:hypothetical protein